MSYPLKHNNEELINTNDCYLVTQFSRNHTNRFILIKLSFPAKVTEIICALDEFDENLSVELSKKSASAITGQCLA